ncbi:LysM domain-containing protein [Granulicella arctica]|uniref:LysM domain-containing protein n=1 Tax=Granulicella arctica TaxID=940613 RepID=UPI0021DFD781|nr:LysM domain-containing protein [Granulicella arctica]
MANYSFPISSRYYNIDTTTLTNAAGEQVTYLLRRFVPDPDQFSLLQYYTVKEGDRLDNVASALMGDPQAFWRIADANRAMNAEKLTGTPGRKLRITLPQGIPGTTNA